MAPAPAVGTGGAPTVPTTDRPPPPALADSVACETSGGGEPKDPRQRGTLVGFQQAVYSVGFTPDGTRLVATSDGKEAVKIWDLVGQRELLTLECEGSWDVHEFSPDGNVLAAVNHSGIRLWQAPSSEEIEATERRSDAGR